MEESTKDEMQLEVLNQVLKEISKSDPSFYYEPTMDIANKVIDFVKNSDELSILNKELLEDLSPNEIQYLLSFHSKKNIK